MRLSVLAFLCGIVLSQHLQLSPKVYWPILITFIFFFKKIPKALIALVIGIIWCTLYTNYQTSWALSSQQEGNPVTITGRITSIPIKNPYTTTFLFTPNHTHAKLRLTWPNNNMCLHPGDVWQLTLKLKKIHTTLNPGGFDYEAYALQEGIRANGSVISGKLIQHHLYSHPINRLRQYIKEKIDAVLPKTTTSQWIYALTIGERQNINQIDWQILRNTGTNHLMAIAGLHIGFMAVLANFLVIYVWRRLPRAVVVMPAQYAGAYGALIIAVTYGALVDFSLPAQRACLMLTVFLLLFVSRRVTQTWQAWCIALFLVLIWNPLAASTDSFWLSFGSVALIIYGSSGRLAPGGLWWQWGRIQWVIAIGLLPLSIWLFQEFSCIGFIANFISIPIIEFFVVPLCFFGCITLLFSNVLGKIFLVVADKLLLLVWKILAFLAHLPNIVWYQYIPSHFVIFIASIGIILLLLPIGFPGRWLGVIWISPLILFQPALPAQGEAWFTLLDVGQGLSAVVQTQHYNLLFDTGPKFGNFDMGESVVLPFLRTIKTKKLDMLVVSHGDNDHIGGSQAVLSRFPTTPVYTSQPEKFSHAQYCLRAMKWRWDGVDFEFLYPDKENLGLDNDSSCVLKITAGSKSILLTGDIEKTAENVMIRNQSDLKADILVAPHHGSKTSALNEFVERVNPQFVLYATGYQNRYHFPHKEVVGKYLAMGAQGFQTSDTGAIQFKLSLTQGLMPTFYRNK